MNQTLSLFKALADRNRLRIVAALREHDELCACQIVELLQVRGSTASRHLQILNGADLIESRKDGRWVYFRLQAENPLTRTVLRWLETQLVKDPQITADSTLLQKLSTCDLTELTRKQREST